MKFGAAVAAVAVVAVAGGDTAAAGSGRVGGLAAAAAAVVDLMDYRTIVCRAGAAVDWRPVQQQQQLRPLPPPQASQSCLLQRLIA